jgi:lysophospholipid acyltransferase (LPLAT)-like uncharacterized protein
MSRAAVKSAGVIVPHALKWHGRLAAAAICIAVRCLSATQRYRVRDEYHFLATEPKGNVIFCAWHNRLALSMPVYNRFLRNRRPDGRMAAMVSASKDGGLLARILESFKVQPVRGSSSRRGPQALLELTTWAERGYDLAITPDGPRGPCYAVQEGVMALAQLTGLPIVPILLSLAPKIRMKSWDRFQIPLPLGKCEVIVGPPMLVPRDISETDRAALRLELERRMKALTRD